MGPEDISVIILTYNEELHIERCIRSVLPFAKRVFVVDCHSTDDTVGIATRNGAVVRFNRWVNHATQLNWALDNLPLDTTWVCWLGADEYVTDQLSAEIRSRLATLDASVAGIYLKRKVFFMGRWIRHGAMYPIRFLRIWRVGHGRCEERWIDEHIALSDGGWTEFEGAFVDDNKHHLGWWIEKHNRYATLEAIEMLNFRYGLFRRDGVRPLFWGTPAERKRRLKSLYASLPPFLRPLCYFCYRYFLRLGFLDGREGLMWHFLQGFWYRFLVDAKVLELSRAGGNDAAGIRKAVEKLYAISIVTDEKE